MSADPTIVLIMLAYLIIGVASIAATLTPRITTGPYEISILWLIFVGSMINMEHAQRTTPGQTVLTVGFALLMVHRCLREFFKKDESKSSTIP